MINHIWNQRNICVTRGLSEATEDARRSWTLRRADSTLLLRAPIPKGGLVYLPHPEFLQLVRSDLPDLPATMQVPPASAGMPNVKKHARWRRRRHKTKFENESDANGSLSILSTPATSSATTISAPSPPTIVPLAAVATDDGSLRSDLPDLPANRQILRLQKMAKGTRKEIHCVVNSSSFGIAAYAQANVFRGRSFSREYYLSSS